MTIEQQFIILKKAVSNVMENWDLERDCPKTSKPMYILTDTPYGKNSYEKKVTRIVCIQQKMEPYLKSTIHDITLNIFSIVHILAIIWIVLPLISFAMEDTTITTNCCNRNMM
jgi:hypothetical protein